jgi:peptide subunit release factor 1 (eRF1)
LGKTLGQETTSNLKISDRTEVGRWSRARENAREENYRMQHASELIEQLDEIVRSEQIDSIILAGDDVVLPTLRDQLSPYLAERIVATLSLDIKTPEHEIRSASHAALREHDIGNDKDRVKAMLDLYHSRRRAVGGVDDVMAALTIGQVEELFVSERLDEQYSDAQDFGELTGSPGGAANVNIADALISQAVQTGARITFIEDEGLLSELGGIAATLRYKV